MVYRRGVFVRVNLPNDLPKYSTQSASSTPDASFVVMQIRQMPLKDFRANYPDDYKSGALEEIRLRYAKLAEEVAQQHRNFPAALQTGAARTARKRGIVPEPATVLHTVKSRRVEPAGRVGLRGDAEPQPRSEAEVEMKVEARTNCNSNEQVNHPTQRHMFNGLPLETPMPFTGAAVPIPMTMVTQRRGGRIPATALPDAVILETADGKKWAVGKDGLSSIPETHRAEVMELIKNQAQFWATLDTSAGHKAPPGRVVTRRR